MNQEFFTNLPSEIVINILSRLPVRTVVSCKCVCKSWLDMVESHEFAKSHLSKSVPALTIYQSDMQSDSYKILEIEDGLDVEHQELRYSIVTKFDFPYAAEIHGSADGLLFLRDSMNQLDALYICNPITREYIQLHCPQEFVYSYPQIITYGFGASKMTGQHKVVRIVQEFIRDQDGSLRIHKSECFAYSLGTRSWRSIAPGDPLKYSSDTIGAFLDGNLHWLVYDLKGFPLVSCIDLETEHFSTFSFPPLSRQGSYLVGVFALEKCLCLCEFISDDYKTVIWLMKEYGLEESWTKEFVIGIPNFGGGEYYVVAYPIKLFEDGDILMALQDFCLFYCSNKTRSAEIIRLRDLQPSTGGFQTILHTPSFISLKSFGVDNVIAF